MFGTNKSLKLIAPIRAAEIVESAKFESLLSSSPHRFFSYEL